jgi:hypothetical protein
LAASERSIYVLENSRFNRDWGRARTSPFGESLMRSFRSTLNVALLGTTLLTTAALAQGTPDRKAFFGETPVFGDLGQAIRDYEARNKSRTKVWLRHFANDVVGQT